MSKSIEVKNKVTGKKKDFYCVCEFCKGEIYKHINAYFPYLPNQWTAEIHELRFKLDQLDYIVKQLVEKVPRPDVSQGATSLEEKINKGETTESLSSEDAKATAPDS